MTHRISKLNIKHYKTCNLASMTNDILFDIIVRFKKIILIVIVFLVV